jgi:ATP-dependent Clp protease ATP-binding subunit ClpB
VSPHNRFIQRELETRIGRQLVAGDIPDGAKIVVALEKGMLAIQRENLKK